MKSTPKHQSPKSGGFESPARPLKPPLGQREASSPRPAGPLRERRREAYRARLRLPGGFSRPWPLGAAEALPAPPGTPPGLGPAPPPPTRSSLPFRPLPPPAEGGSRAAAAFTSSSCGRKVHRAPGPLSGGCAAAPLRAAHKAAPRVPPPPAPERRWGWRCRGGAVAAGGDAGRVSAGRGDTAALRLAEEKQPRKRILRERVLVCSPRNPGPARRHLAQAGSANPDPDAPRSGARPAVSAPGSRRLSHTPAGHASGARARERRARASLPPLPPQAVPPPPSGLRRWRAGQTAPPPGWRQDLPRRTPPGGPDPKGERRRSRLAGSEPVPAAL
ncbi:basic proline-rich protein-like [Physeter macrocephalus]|uniref:Basic proline-rich protein-like n=1 Tax=Physeter macrocephalus TaxID=9755 RepID=A0A2Y9SEI0_PHYMC|nr:basic proline-rich protein-like [Physeter catodon]|eukprot:XP_023974189.1 basic proline-rich protein-like [Physeter catodon]